MRDSTKVITLFLLVVAIFLLMLPAMQRSGIFRARTQGLPLRPGTVVVPILVSVYPTENNLQLQTFPFVTATPIPTTIPTVFSSKSEPVTPGSPIPITQPKIGGPAAPEGYYCIDDENASGCDDSSSFLVPKGTGGVLGSCGTVIDQAHKLIANLPHDIKYGGASSGFPEGIPRDRLQPEVTNCGYSSGSYQSGYLSTYLIIDAFNLAGFKELSKTNPNHVRGTDLLSWWNSAEAKNSGYKFIPYTPAAIQQWATGQQDLTGCVMFLKFPSGAFPGIVNKFEITNTNGDGVISLLMSNAIMYIDRFIVSSWAIQNTLEHSAGSSKPTIAGVEGFGCH